jgi:hypothetical protein
VGQRAAPGRPEVPGRPPAQRAPLGDGSRADLGVAAVGLLEVVADELAMGAAGAGLEPAGVGLVQLGARGLGQEPVGDVADEDVGEAVAGLAGQLLARGPDQLTALERGEGGVEPRPLGRRQQLGDGRMVEVAALDGGAVDHRPLGRGQRVDARGQQRLDRGRRPGAARRRLGAHRDHLLEEQRVALGGGQQALALLDRQVAGGEVLD